MSVVSVDKKKPRFLLTIDTEGDNLWSAPRVITTKNAGFIHRFQNLCETYNLRPTYLVDYEMSRSPVFVELGRDVLQRQVGEIGMHLHAWNTPPIISLTADDFKLLPYLYEYDRIVMQEKVAVMTNILEEVFDLNMVSHRAGRWGLNEVYVQILVGQGYLVDCSVTPHVSWRQSGGDPRQQGGTDYSDFPDKPYFVSHDDISQAGDSPLLELPVTIMSERTVFREGLHRLALFTPLLKRVANRLFPLVHWLRPNGKNRRQMLNIVRQAVRENRSYVELALHSSELMPGGSPTFPDERSIETLYQDLEVLFGYSKGTCCAKTLHEFYKEYVSVEGEQKF